MAKVVKEFENGVVVYQISDGEELVSNIYCERPYCSPDGHRFLYARKTSAERGDWEFVLCEFGSWQERVAGRGRLNPAISYDGDYYYPRAAADALEFVRLDLATGEQDVRFVLKDDSAHIGHPTVSPGGRLLAFHRPLSYFAAAVRHLRGRSRGRCLPARPRGPVPV